MIYIYIYIFFFFQVTDGPVPWAQSNQLCFIAEQVSHHPPVSAFYAEHKDQRIQFNGHIWTKSKFLGLSVGVHNIGQGWSHETAFFSSHNPVRFSVYRTSYVLMTRTCNLFCHTVLFKILRV